MTYKNNLKKVFAYLSFSLKSALTGVKNLPDNLQEIHLITDKPLILHTNNKRFYVSCNYVLTEKLSDNLIKVSKDELKECFNKICNYSVYSRQNEIINGFITLSGGNRAGICGTALNKDSSVYNIRDITSINIRVANEIKDCSDFIFNKISDIKKGVLICGEPCSGKTTILRDIARRLSYNYKVSLIDSRFELAACFNGKAEFDVGFCDIFNGYDKRSGFEHAVRCMSPEFVICDEISDDDINAVSMAEKSGASVIASLHCGGKDELKSKVEYKKLSGCFGYFVFLKSRQNAGQVCEIIKGKPYD